MQNLPAYIKRIFPIVRVLGIASVCALSAFIPSSTQLQGDRFSDVLEKGKGTITLTYIDTPGIIYKDESGQVVGVCADIMEKFIQYVERSKNVKLSVRYQGQTDNFKSFYTNVKTGTGGVFGLGNVTITDERKKELKFSPPFISNVSMILSHSSAPTLSNIAEVGTVFKGMTVYTVEGTSNEKRILELKKNYHPDLQIMYLASSREVLEKVADSPNTFTILDFSYFLKAMKERKTVKRHPVGDKGAEKSAIAMPYDSDWAGVMKDFFANGTDSSFVGSVEYKQIIANHLGVPALQMISQVK